MYTCLQGPLCWGCRGPCVSALAACGARLSPSCHHSSSYPHQPAFLERTPYYCGLLQVVSGRGDPVLASNFTYTYPYLPLPLHLPK